ncbi:SWIRM domain-containing protein [Ustulina deusta]|nr:SWIRM domain-containing protein [Ustulina deusta]KAI3334464.1 SWIRM domain-containing protein [Ustulina deusta]
MASMSAKLPEPKKPCDINNLMSPPEPPKLESFAHHNNNRNNNINMSKPIDAVMSDARRLPGAVQPLSPPISPATKPDDNVMNGVVTSAKDPILFPPHDITNSPPPQPLFVREQSADARQIVHHVLTRPAELFQNATPPEQDDYELVLYFQSQVMKKYLANPRSWLKRERALLIADRQAQARQRHFKLQPILPAKTQPIRKEVQRAKPARAPKVTKPTVAKPTPTKPRPIRAGPGPVGTSTAAAAATPAGLTKHIARAPSSTPDPSPRRGTTQTRADDDFESVPDYCPPLDSMPSKLNNSLRMEWKTGITDLSNDPHRHLLHEEEITLASSLRLTAAVYLTSKRRIFVRRLECLRVGKEFRKTDAQQACKIDVNKASKLWTAFERIGWLEKSWVAKYL